MANRPQNRLKIFLPNKVIWYLTFSDIFSWGVLGAFGSLLGVYLAMKFGERVETVVGIGIAMQLFSRSISQLIVARISDKFPGTKDEIWLMIGGALIVGTGYILLTQITVATQFYAIQAAAGLGIAMNLIGWRKLFASNLDENNEGMDYGIYDSTFSMATAGISVVFGLLANQGEQEFNLVVMIVGVSVIISSLWPVMISRELKIRSGK